MAQEHWLDRLSRALVPPVPRRAFLGAAAAVATNLALGVAPSADARKNQRKRKKKGKGKQKGPPSATPACSGGACAAQWPDDVANRDYCEFICRQCATDDRRTFCIAEGNPDDPAKVATCCAVGAVCCGTTCCGDPGYPWLKCCGDVCTNTNDNLDHCGGCNSRCPDGWRCCGNSCFDVESSPTNCGACGIDCAPDEECIGGLCVASSQCPPGLTECPPQGCVDTRTDIRNCGSCGNACTGGLGYCVNGQCGCHPASSDVVCGTNCIPRGFTCCTDCGGYGCSNNCRDGCRCGP